jgi:hypothetical protein
MCDRINEIGREAALAELPKYKAQFSTAHGTPESDFDGGSKAYLPEYFTHYTCVARITANDLEDVFHISNCGNAEEKIERLLPMHSLSVGDIVIDENDERFIVDPIGFESLGC